MKDKTTTLPLWRMEQQLQDAIDRRDRAQKAYDAACVEVEKLALLVRKGRKENPV